MITLIFIAHFNVIVQPNSVNFFFSSSASFAADPFFKVTGAFSTNSFASLSGKLNIYLTINNN